MHFAVGCYSPDQQCHQQHQRSSHLQTAQHTAQRQKRRHEGNRVRRTAFCISRLQTLTRGGLHPQDSTTVKTTAPSCCARSNNVLHQCHSNACRCCRVRTASMRSTLRHLRIYLGEHMLRLHALMPEPRLYQLQLLHSVTWSAYLEPGTTHSQVQLRTGLATPSAVHQLPLTGVTGQQPPMHPRLPGACMCNCYSPWRAIPPSPVHDQGRHWPALTAKWAPGSLAQVAIVRTVGARVRNPWPTVQLRKKHTKCCQP